MSLRHARFADPGAWAGGCGRRGDQASISVASFLPVGPEPHGDCRCGEGHGERGRHVMGSKCRHTVVIPTFKSAQDSPAEAGDPGDAAALVLCPRWRQRGIPNVRPARSHKARCCREAYSLYIPLEQHTRRGPCRLSNHPVDIQMAQNENSQVWRMGGYMSAHARPAASTASSAS